MLIETPLADDLLDPALELGGLEELPAKLLAGFQTVVQLADPEIEAAQLPAPAQEGVVQVADVIAVAPLAVGVLGAGGELLGDRLHLGVDRRRALALGGAEPVQPVLEPGGVGQPVEEAPVEVHHGVHLAPAGGVAQQTLHVAAELGGEQEGIQRHGARHPRRQLPGPEP